MSNGSKIKVPAFEQEVVFDNLRSAYWVEALDINGDGDTDLVGHGMSLSEIYWYENQQAKQQANGKVSIPAWERHLLAGDLKMPVGMDGADITRNGLPDLVVCYDLYGGGGTFRDPAVDGGKISWLENPGPTGSRRWQQRHVGNMPAMHRLRIGHFTQTDRLEIIGFPIVAPLEMHGVVNVVLFEQPDDVQKAENWPMRVVDDSHFRFVHGVEKKAGLVPGSNLDSLIVSSDEGVTWLYFDKTVGTWIREIIGEGELGQVEKTRFKGSGDADVGGMGGDPFAYVAALEPFHGNTVAVYVKSHGSDGQLKWTRHLLDVFGDPNASGEGPGHSVVCADFDGDGEDEFLVGLRGPDPWQGVMYYKAIDLANGVFTKWKISSESVARIALGDFGGSGGKDFATIGYSIENYFQATNAKLVVHRNRTG